MLSESLKNLMLAGLGAVAITKEKLDALTADLVEKGRMSKEEAERFSREMAEEAGHQAEALAQKAREAAREAVKQLNLASEDRVEELERRLEVLEAKVAGMVDPDKLG